MAERHAISIEVRLKVLRSQLQTAGPLIDVETVTILVGLVAALRNRGP